MNQSICYYVNVIRIHYMLLRIGKLYDYTICYYVLVSYMYTICVVMWIRYVINYKIESLTSQSVTATTHWRQYILRLCTWTLYMSMYPIEFRHHLGTTLQRRIGATVSHTLSQRQIHLSPSWQQLWQFWVQHFVQNKCKTVTNFSSNLKVFYRHVGRI